MKNFSILNKFPNVVGSGLTFNSNGQHGTLGFFNKNIIYATHCKDLAFSAYMNYWCPNDVYITFGFPINNEITFETVCERIEKFFFKYEEYLDLERSIFYKSTSSSVQYLILKPNKFWLNSGYAFHAMYNILRAGTGYAGQDIFTYRCEESTYFQTLVKGYNLYNQTPITQVFVNKMASFIKRHRDKLDLNNRIWENVIQLMYIFGSEAHPLRQKSITVTSIFKSAYATRIKQIVSSSPLNANLSTAQVQKLAENKVDYLFLDALLEHCFQDKKTVIDETQNKEKELITV